jgi:hypothetical protein
MNNIKPILSDILKTSNDTKTGELATIATSAADTAAKSTLSFGKLVVIAEAITTILDKVGDILKQRPDDVVFQNDVKTKLDHLNDTLKLVKDKFDQQPAKTQIDDLLRKTDDVNTNLTKQLQDLDSIDATTKSTKSAIDAIKNNTDQIAGKQNKLDKLDKLDRLDDVYDKASKSLDDLDDIKYSSKDSANKLGDVKDILWHLSDLLDVAEIKSCPDGSNQSVFLPCPVPQASVTCSGGVASVSCSGDPVNCAILKTQSSLECPPEVPTFDDLPKPEFPNDTSADWSASASNVIDGSFFGTLRTGAIAYMLTLIGSDTPKHEDVDVSSKLDTTGLGWAGSCPSPQAYSLGSLGSMTIDYQPFCNLAGITSFFVIFSASIISIRILFSIT